MSEPNPKLVELEAPGHYTLPMPEAFDNLMPARYGEKARIRFRLSPGISLDIPLSEASLFSLSHALQRLFPHQG